ncbi:hypothetical protein RvY_03146 [Ramazzottius varieornatus]|uniref:Uncharacterized protein n=1 Tax=Ramazzottius varieornatus TaxID=947166 RepID=A0A1D1UST3_RAMVA|nr:hypothetical protein RvY_03146 [Ramazzottius varieornatus]
MDSLNLQIIYVSSFVWLLSPDSFLVRRMSTAASSSCGKQCSLRKRRRYRELSSISLRLAKKDLLKASNVVEGVELKDDIDLIKGDIGKVGSRLHRTSAQFPESRRQHFHALSDPEERLETELGVKHTPTNATGSSSCGKLCLAETRNFYRKLNDESVHTARRLLSEALGRLERIKLERDINAMKRDIGTIVTQLRDDATRYYSFGWPLAKL